MNRNKFTILAEIQKEDKKMDSFPMGHPGRIESIKKITNLRHELKLLSMVSATGKDAEAIKSYWKNKAKIERNSQIERKKIEKERLEKAKKQVTQELKEDKGKLKELLKGLSPEERKEILDEFSEDKKTL